VKAKKLVDIPITLTFKVDVYSGDIYANYHNQDADDNSKHLQIIGGDLPDALRYLASKIQDIIN